MQNGDGPSTELDLHALRSLSSSKQCTDATLPVNSATYSRDGMQMILSTDDDSIYLYDLSSGQKSRSVNSKKYGASHVKFASDATCAIHGSTKIDHTIRYLSLADNKYIRYFTGHTELVTGLRMSPNDDMFLSVSRDKTLRLWDLRTYNCMGIMNLDSVAIADFDPEGLIYAAGTGQGCLKLYDLRSFDKGPFSSFEVPAELKNIGWTSMKFSPCGKMILICTNSDKMILIDAFTGIIKSVLEGHLNQQNIALNASFSPDSNFIVCGSSDNSLYAWSTESGQIVHRFQTPHEQTPNLVEFNPVYISFTSADKKIVLWCPSEEIGT
ncbi:unnamed protein product [Caenorhabditis angaria]|uniref:Anaphase-promoting complex subunit 4 WD40 domain-containing protein n=1 Tax=Caenorhabditis angaria TaxID=860376 RepID=A0A9P1IMT5_9PELO|nr:unnamed protein product [Caenorhabditis angaria]